MQNRLILLNRCLLFFSALVLVMPALFLALTVAEASETEMANADWQLTIKNGYRTDDLDWSIAGLTPTDYLDPALRGQYVNILSELTWQDLDIFQLDFGIEKRIDRHFRLVGQLDIGFVFDGKVQDSDYAGDNRTAEFSRAVADADDGFTWDMYFGFGYEFTFLGDILALSPLVGLSYHAQNLNMTNGVQTLSAYGWETVSPTGPFSYLDSTYDASWLGPWIGLEFSIRAFQDAQGNPRHEAVIGGEYHMADYYAQANWNLRADFQHPKSFEHEADGHGIVFKLAYKYNFRPRWGLVAEGKYQKWETDSGIDRVFFSDGTVGTTPLNKVNWESYALTFGVVARF